MHVRPESHLIFILIADLLQSRLQMPPENASTNAIETGDTNASAIEAANASTNASHEHICKYIFQMHLQMHVRPEVQMSLQSRMQMHPAKPSASASCKWCLASMSCKFISKCTRPEVQMHLQSRMQMYPANASTNVRENRGTNASATEAPNIP